MSVGKNDFAHPQIVAANIKFYRKRRKMKQKELADLIGYTESSISKYEQGLIQIPNTVIDLLAKALDVSPIDLLGEKQNVLTNSTSENIAFSIGENIKFYRKKAGFQQKELAEKVGVSAPAIMRYEKGQREPSKEIIEKIAMALNISPVLLMNWDSWGEECVPDINKRIKEIRIRLNLSQEEFGNSIGLSKSGISNIENGTRSVTPKHIKLIGLVYNINESWLKTGIPDPDEEFDEYKHRIGKIAGIISSARKRLGMTQIEFANLLSITESSVRKYEAGLIDIPIKMLCKISKILEIDFNTLLGCEYKTLGEYTLEEIFKEIERRVNNEEGIGSMY